MKIRNTIKITFTIMSLLVYSNLFASSIDSNLNNNPPLKNNNLLALNASNINKCCPCNVVTNYYYCSSQTQCCPCKLGNHGKQFVPYSCMTGQKK